MDAHKNVLQLQQQPQWYSVDSEDDGQDQDDSDTSDGDLFDDDLPVYFPTASGPNFAVDSPERPRSNQPNMTIHVKIEGWSTKIRCGAGNQSLKWLCLTAVERYRIERTPNGRVRARESNRPLRRRRPDEDSQYNPLRGIRGSHIPSDIKLKKSLKKVIHHLASIQLAKKKKIHKTANFWQNPTTNAAKEAREATTNAATASLGLINKNFQDDTAKPALGLDDCCLLKTRGRGGDGNRIPDPSDPLRLHLQHEDSVTILLDEQGGHYIQRNRAFSVTAYMRLRYVQARKHQGLHEESSSGSEGSDDDGDDYIIYVRARSKGKNDADRNTTKQVKENLSNLSLHKFVKDETQHDALKQIFMDHTVYDDLRRLFRHYAYGGAGDAFSMDVGEWESCCKDGGILEHPEMTYGKVDTAFIAANYTAKATNKQAKKDTKVTGGKLDLIAGNPDNAFTLYEFIEGIMRLSVSMWPDDKLDKRAVQNKQDEELRFSSHAEKVRAILNRHFIPLAKSLSSNWDMFHDIEEKEVQKIYHDNMTELEEKFRYYCNHRKKNVRKMHLTMDGYIALIESSGLLREDDVLVTASTTHRVIKECFVWSQRKSTNDHHGVLAEEQSLNRMDFNEFLESLALLAHRTFSQHPDWTHVSGAEAKHLGVQLAALLALLLATRREGILSTKK
jgi:hypothetical protein